MEKRALWNMISFIMNKTLEFFNLFMDGDRYLCIVLNYV
jgi:hypothetical protein